LIAASRLREDKAGEDRREQRGEGRADLAFAEAISDFLKASDSKVSRMVSTSASSAGQAVFESKVLGSEER
jgi:tRNA U34 5-carboxymethylaminomethyl modifying GTPase MnmE/TrmE